MSRRTNWSLILCAIIVMATAAVADTGSHTSANGLVKGDWITSPGSTNVVYCPGSSSNCGLKYATSGYNYLTDTYGSFNGWHNYNPSTNTNLTSYLNGLGVNSSWDHTHSVFGQHFTFTLSDSGSSPSATALHNDNCYDASNCPGGTFRTISGGASLAATPEIQAIS